MRPRPEYRRIGALTIESAFVLPVLFFLLLAIIVGGMGVFRYQLVACQAREAARFAAVRGADWEFDPNNTQSPLTKSDIVQKVVQPMAIGMDVSQLSVKVEWIDQGANTIQDWDVAPKYVKSLTPQGEYITNSVRVTVTYNWVPEFFLGACKLQSVCELPMSN